jgi:Golgi apparatus protein 1
MGGRVIACLRSKYANTNIQLETQCRTELVDVIQASKLDIQLDVRLYQECKNILRSQCLGADKEDCLKILYQQKKISEKKCREQVLRIIKEGKADIHVDPSLLATCQADVLKFCNDIPMGKRIYTTRAFFTITIVGSGKQLQCLLKNKRALVKPCKELLSKRQELWQAVGLSSAICRSRSSPLLF